MITRPASAARPSLLCLTCKLILASLFQGAVSGMKDSCENRCNQQQSKEENKNNEEVIRMEKRMSRKFFTVVLVTSLLVGIGLIGCNRNQGGDSGGGSGGSGGNPPT